ncbi:MAG: hypothetical protein WCG47_23970 [Dermatophilaceae bacterium]
MIPTPTAPHSARAIVLGASLTGLLTATALAAHCREVLVVDRDPLDGDLDAPRKGVPQGKHSHGLLVGGLRAMEALLPGLTDELVDRGALPSDIIRDSVWIMRGAPVARFDSGLVGLLGTRTLLESQVRRRVRAIPAVRLLGEHDVVRLTATSDGRRVTRRGARSPVGWRPGHPQRRHCRRRNRQGFARPPLADRPRLPRASDLRGPRRHHLRHPDLPRRARPASRH